jgi:hypothetical protein
VVKWLMDKGIRNDRMVSQGYGDTKPTADNKSKTGRAKNRRIEIAVLESVAPPAPPAKPEEPKAPAVPVTPVVPVAPAKPGATAPAAPASLTAPAVPATPAAPVVTPAKPDTGKKK